LRNKNIDIYVIETEELKEEFNKNKISNNLAKYLINECRGIHYNSNININIYTKEELSKEEQEEITLMIKNHFITLIKESIITAKVSMIREFILTILGIVLILISSVISKYTEILLPELFLIAGWVAIWEVVYNILFTNSKNKIEKRRYKKLFKANIYFGASKE